MSLKKNWQFKQIPTWLFIYALALIYEGVSWILNFVMFVKSDFTTANQDVIVHGLGVVIPPLAGITVWL